MYLQLLSAPRGEEFKKWELRVESWNNWKPICGFSITLNTSFLLYLPPFARNLNVKWWSSNSITELGGNGLMGSKTALVEMSTPPHPLPTSPPHPRRPPSVCNGIVGQQNTAFRLTNCWHKTKYFMPVMTESAGNGLIFFKGEKTAIFWGYFFHASNWKVLLFFSQTNRRANWPTSMIRWHKMT